MQRAAVRDKLACRMIKVLIHPPVEEEVVVTPRPVRKVVQVVTKEVVLLVTVKIKTITVIVIKALRALL